MTDMKTHLKNLSREKSKSIEYIAYLILMRSMLRNSHLPTLTPAEERILNYLSIEYHLGRNVSFNILLNLVPGVDEHSMKQGVKSLKDKGYVTSFYSSFDSLNDPTNFIELTDQAYQYLSGMGYCVINASNQSC